MSTSNAKIRAKLLSGGTVLVSVHHTMHTPKRHSYESVEHYELQPVEAEALLYDLHSVVQTLRGIKKRPSKLRRLLRIR